MNTLISSCKWYLLSTKNLPTIEINKIMRLNAIKLISKSKTNVIKVCMVSKLLVTS